MITHYSIIVPVYNEELNLPILHSKITKIQKKLKNTEVIYINDGSFDNSLKLLSKFSKDKNVRVISFARNFGQSASISAGIDYSKGKILIFIDGDLQNDPEDIPIILKKMNEGYDMVSGWRKDRKDDYLKVIFSKIANYLITIIFQIPIHDLGCTLKACRRVVLKDVQIYGEMHRLFPIIVKYQGGNITDIVVHHYPRRYGKSKYGFSRITKVIIDALTLKFMYNYSTKPAYLFGNIGFGLIVLSLLFYFIIVIEKAFSGVYVHRNPLFIIAIFIDLVAIQAILLGLIAELLMRTYFESQKKKPYLIKFTQNI